MGEEGVILDEGDDLLSPLDQAEKRSEVSQSCQTEPLGYVAPHSGDDCPVQSINIGVWNK